METRPEPRIDLTAAEVRALFEELLPAAEIEAFAGEVGNVERARKVNVVRFCRTAVISANMPTGGMQADAMRAYERAGGKKASRSSWYQCFDESFEMVIAKARTEVPDLPQGLSGVKDWFIDWFIANSITAKIREAFPAGMRATLSRHSGRVDAVSSLITTQCSP